MDEKGRLRFILDFCHLQLPTIFEHSVYILTVFHLISPFQGGKQNPHIPGLSCDALGCRCGTDFANCAHPYETWFRKQQDGLAPHGEESVPGCVGAMMSTSCGGQQWKFLVSGPKQRRLSRGGSDVSLENPMRWLEFPARWLQVWLLSLSKILQTIL